MSEPVNLMSGVLWGRYDLPSGFDPMAVTRSNGHVTNVYRKCNGHVLPTDVWPETLVLTKLSLRQVERDFCIDNLLVRIHLIIWEYEFPSPDSLISTFLGGQVCTAVGVRPAGRYKFERTCNGRVTEV